MGFWQILSATAFTSGECSVAENMRTCAAQHGNFIQPRSLGKLTTVQAELQHSIEAKVGWSHRCSSSQDALYITTLLFTGHIQGAQP